MSEVNANKFDIQKTRVITSRAAKLSLVVGVMLMMGKFWAYHLTGSQAVFSDALESVINVLTALLALFVVYYAAIPKDVDHPYGHGKAEYFSAAFEGGLIAFAAIFIVVASIRTLIVGVELIQLDTGLLIVAGAGIGNLLLGLYLKQIGSKHNSLVLRASAQHVMSDFWTSLGIVIGLFIVKITGIYWLDPVIALVVACLLAYHGLHLVRESIGGLMDAEDQTVLRQLSEVFTQRATEGVIQIHHLRVIRSGSFHHIDGHVVVPEFWSIDVAHEEIAKLEGLVLEDYSFEGEISFHLDPCRQAYCRFCTVQECPIRKESFEKKLPFNLDHLRATDEPEEFLI